MSNRAGAVSSPHESGQYRVLDAGCGAGREIALPAGAHLVGIDMSALALERNPFIAERIVGDVQSHPLEPSSFDEIVSWYVFEHLPRPELAFRNLARALKPGGALRITVPNLLSAKGLTTRLTPLWFHRLAYRVLFPGFDRSRHEGPFKTYLRWSVRPRGLASLASRHGLEIERLQLYAPEGLESFWDEHPLIRVLCRVLWPFSDPRLTECELIARRPRDRHDEA
jgi:SAM-dependent methyltransferase